jgi:streptogramin lyase
MERVTPTGYVPGEGSPPSSLAKAQTYVIGAYKDELVAYLARVRGPDSSPLNLTTLPRPSGEATRVVVTEYDLTRPDEPAGWVMPHNGSDWSEGTPSRYEGRGPHDVVVDRQGMVWIADDATPGRTIAKLDPRTGRITEFVLSNDNHVDSTHAMAIDRNGNIWAADDTAGVPLEFVPETEKFKTYPKTVGLPRVGDFVAVDSRGNVWAPYIDGAVKLDPQSGKYTIYTIPTKGKSTYGIDADRNDNIWIAQPTADKVAMIDAQTGESSEVAVNPVDTNGMEVTDKDREIYATLGGQNTGPLLQVGPRRLAADKTSDYVWTAEHFANRIAKINIATKKVTEYPMPHPYMQPYAIAVDKDHMVWVTSITSDRVVKFNPTTERFTEYELPTRGTESRHIYADNRTDPPTIWIPYDRTNKVARIQFRTGKEGAPAGN